jgi:CO dehydrogenase/acetyl-CoA synthase alpha subunit
MSISDEELDDVIEQLRFAMRKTKPGCMCQFSPRAAEVALRCMEDVQREKQEGQRPPADTGA